MANVDVDPRRTLRTLQVGNQQWSHAVAAPLTHRAVGETKALAVVIACSDLCVSPEAAFGLLPGQLLVAQVPGPFVDDGVIDTVYFGLQVLGVRLVVVLAHESCRVLCDQGGGARLPGTAVERLGFQLLNKAKTRKQHRAQTCAQEQVTRLHTRARLPPDVLVVPAVLWNSGVVEMMIPQ